MRKFIATLFLMLWCAPSLLTLAMRKTILALLLVIWSAPAWATAYFGVCSTTCTWDNSSTAMWSLSSGGATGAGPPTSTDSVTFDAATCVGGITCTITPSANINVTSITMGACTASTTGCVLDFSVNNNNITFTACNCTSFNISGTGVRVLRMGNGNWTFNNTNGTIWTAATSTNLTLTRNSSTIITNLTNGGNTVTFNTGPSGNTYNNLTVNGNANRGTFNIVGGNVTFNNITFNGPNYIDYGGGGTQTFTSLTIAGTISNIVSFSQPQWIGGSVSSNYAWIRNGACGSGLTFGNSLDGGQNSNCTTVAPSTGGGRCIIGGWLLWRDMPEHINDNFPAWINEAA